jgi:hypothetical protein
MIASKGARRCFARAMHNGVNNGADAAENSERARPAALVAQGSATTF